MDREDVYMCIYIYTAEYYAAVKKNKPIPSAAVRMDPGTIVLSEVRQTERDRYHVVSAARGT